MQWPSYRAETAGDPGRTALLNDWIQKQNKFEAGRLQSQTLKADAPGTAAFGPSAG